MTKDNFKFDINAKKIRIVDRDIIESLRKYAQLKNNEYFSTTEYDDWAEKVAGSGTFIDRFGSWNKALLNIGIEGGHERKYTIKELIENLEGIWEELGFPPGKRQLAKYGKKISERPYVRNWGSVKLACEQIALFHDGKISREQLLLESKKKSGRKEISLKTRYKVLKRDHYTCQICGRSPAKDPSVVIEIDHIIPVAKNGLNDSSNLQVLCKECNQGKKDIV